MSSFSTCQLCHRQLSLKGPAPFLLPCLHAVCETCMRSEARGVISCCTCQTKVDLKRIRLNKDVIREKEILQLTVRQHRELVLCTLNDGNQAIYWCKECDNFLCEHCHMTHIRLKATRKHDVQVIDALQSSRMDEEEYCKIHPKYILDTWDNTCSLLICAKCTLGDHLDHKTIDADKAVETARGEVEQVLKDVQDAVGQHDARLATEDQGLQALEEKCDILAENISFTLNSTKYPFEQREKELQIKLQQHREKVRGKLQETRITSEAYRQRCKTVFDYISKTLQYSSGHDILKMKTMFEEKIEECLSSIPIEDYKPQPLPVFSTEGLEKMKSTLAKFGDIALEEEVPTAQTKVDAGVTDDETLTQDVKQLKECQERLIKQEQKVKRIAGLYELRTSTQGLDLSGILYCTRVEFDHTKYRADKLQINAEGEMINKALPTPPVGVDRLKKYVGTTSTVPITPSEFLQYWEAKARLGLKGSLNIPCLLLEIGLSGDGDLDQSHCVKTGPNSYSLNLSYCTAHRSICRGVWRRGNHLVCLPESLKSVPGTSVTLHYGVVYDSVRCRIAFIDVRNMEIIYQICEVDTSVPLWPVFGLYNRKWATLCMSLVVGSDISMTVGKKELILESIS